MNEIKKCSIAGVSFTLEKSAYQRLQTYIKSLHDTYEDNPDGEEIIADIEARIAELILSAQPAEAIITLPLIENIVKQLGSAEQIDEQDTDYHADTTDQNGNPRIPRRLYRDLENGKLGGVCAGLGNYFDIDTAWVRLAFFAPLILTAFGTIDFLNWFVPFTGNIFGVAVLGYIVMWLAVPPASSARQKLEMKGERITARSIHQTTQNAAIDERERTLLAKIMIAVGNLLLILLKIAALFILIGLVTGASILCFVGLISSTALLTTDFITGLAISCFFAVICLPVLVLIYLTLMLLISHRPNNRALMATFILWLIALVIMTLAAIKSPVRFDRQIGNTFESVFENDDDILYKEFSDQEREAFREKIDNSQQKVIQLGNATLTLQGADKQIEQIAGSINIDKQGVHITGEDGDTIEITPQGITLNGEKFLQYTTETIESADGSTKALIFSIGDVRVRFEQELDSEYRIATVDEIQQNIENIQQATQAQQKANEAQQKANKEQEKLNNEARKAMQ